MRSTEIHSASSHLLPWSSLNHEQLVLSVFSCKKLRRLSYMHIPATLPTKANQVGKEVTTVFSNISANLLANIDKVLPYMRPRYATNGSCFDSSFFDPKLPKTFGSSKHEPEWSQERDQYPAWIGDRPKVQNMCPSFDKPRDVRSGTIAGP